MTGENGFHASITDDEQVRRFYQNSTSVRASLANCAKWKQDMRALKGQVQGIRDAEITKELNDWKALATEVFDIG